MSALISLVVLLALLSLLNMVLSIGLIRRVREHGERLAVLGSDTPDLLLRVGETVEEFDTTTLDGEPLSRATLPGGTIVGFFAPYCETCHELLPGFVEWARRNGDRDRALAVIQGTADEASEMTGSLAPVARIVVEERRGAIARAFRLKGTPAFCQLDDNHAVSAVGYEPDPRSMAKI